MRINDKETQAIADLYREMIGEQVAGKSALTGQELVTALVTACMSKWYDLTSKFQARPEIYDVAPTDANDSYNVMKLNPGSDVRDDAFEAIIKSTNDIAKELNRLFGKDVFEPRITRQHGKLEALVAFSQNEGGVFQAKGEATEGHTTIHITMPKEAELERAFSAMTDTPHHGDTDGAEGVGDLDDTIDADPIAGDPSPDYDPEFDVAADADQDEVDAEFGDLDAEPEGDPMDDLSAEEADAAFEDEPRRPRGRFEGLYLDALDVLNEAADDMKPHKYVVKDEHGQPKYEKTFPNKRAAEDFRDRQTDKEMIGGVVMPVETKNESYDGDTNGPKIAKPGEGSNPNNKPMPKKPGEKPDSDKDTEKDEEKEDSNSRAKSFREYTEETEDIANSIEGEGADAEELPMNKELVEEVHTYVGNVLRWLENRNQRYKIYTEIDEITWTRREAFFDAKIGIRSFGGLGRQNKFNNDKVRNLEHSVADFLREIKSEYMDSAYDIKAFIELDENTILDITINDDDILNLNLKRIRDYITKKSMVVISFGFSPRDHIRKDAVLAKRHDRPVVEFVDDREDGEPGFEPKQGQVPLDMATVESLEGMFRKAIRKKMYNPEGGTTIGPRTIIASGVRIEVASIVFYLDREKVVPPNSGNVADEIADYSKQLLSHWKKFVGGDEEFDITPDPLDDDTFRLRGCSHSGLDFDVYIKSDGDLEVHIDRIRSTDAPAVKAFGDPEGIEEEAPAVSVGGAQGAGSSPAPEVVKNIGKKKKTKVQRRNEAHEAEMDAINEALKRGRI